MPEKTLLEALTPGNWITLASMALTVLWSWFTVKTVTARNREDIKTLSSRVNKLQDNQHSLEVAQAEVKVELSAIRRLLEGIDRKFNG
jgi:type VI protein secretion system component VasK